MNKRFVFWVAFCWVFYTATEMKPEVENDRRRSPKSASVHAWVGEYTHPPCPPPHTKHAHMTVWQLGLRLGQPVTNQVWGDDHARRLAHPLPRYPDSVASRWRLYSWCVLPRTAWLSGPLPLCSASSANCWRCRLWCGRHAPPGLPWFSHDRGSCLPAAPPGSQKNRVPWSGTGCVGAWSSLACGREPQGYKWLVGKWKSFKPDFRLPKERNTNCLH